MQVNNNYQPSFRSLLYYTKQGHSVEKNVKDILYKKLPTKEVDSFLKTLKKSPVETILGIVDAEPLNRLNAIVSYKHPNSNLKSYEYIEEGTIRNLLNFKPYKFIHDVLMNVESTEETYQIGRYANK